MSGTRQLPAAGYFGNGQPYNRYGDGPEVLVVFQGLSFENKPQTGITARLYASPYGAMTERYTIYTVLPKPGMPAGYSLKDIADDYARMIRDEFGGPIDVIGVSTGGSIVQHFAADHPELVRRLVIHSSAHTLGEAGKAAQLLIAHYARRRQWRMAYGEMISFVLPRTGFKRIAYMPMAKLGAVLMGTLGAPKDPSDLVTVIEAEDKHAFRDRLAEIEAPTLVIAGDRDPFYSEPLFRQTAAGIPGSRLVLYKGVGHPAGGKRFGRDVHGFLHGSSK